jgi:hypothetical protein
MSHAENNLSTNRTGAHPRWLWRLVRRFWLWILRRPDNSPALLNIRDAARALHRCTNWQTWADPGEEEHGHNPSRRRCADCGKIQHAYFHRFGNTRITWSDAPNAKAQPDAQNL